MPGTLDRSRITLLLAAAGQGDDGARERLWNVIYEELHALARQQMARERDGHRPGVGAAGSDLQPTALVHEAFLRLVGGGNGEPQWENRRQFFASAAKIMRRIRVDDARSRKRMKRGGGRGGAPFDSDIASFDEDAVQTLAIEEALQRLEQLDPVKAEVVTLRYHAGLSVEETAGVLGIATRTVESYWSFARTWLYRELAGE